MRIPITYPLTRGVMTSNRTRLNSKQVYVVTFDCRTHGIEDEGTFEGFWTGEVDTWGKLTFERISGEPPIYLFPDELVSVDVY